MIKDLEKTNYEVELDRGEAIIKGSIIPSFSKCVKIGIGLIGLGFVTQNPIVPAIALIGGIAASKRLTRKERMLTGERLKQFKKDYPIKSLQWMSEKYGYSEGSIKVYASNHGLKRKAGTIKRPRKTKNLTKDQLLSQITGLLGGRVSEEMFLDEISTGASDDFKKNSFAF